MTGFDCKRIFVDTAPFIYLLEDNEHYIAKMQSIFVWLTEKNIPMLTSTITCEEYLVHPYRSQQPEKEDAFFDFLQDADIRVVPIDMTVAKTAAKIRAAYPSFKAMDSLQLATAVQYDCDSFLTNDKQLQSFDKISCLLVDEWSICQ